MTQNNTPPKEAPRRQGGNRGHGGPMGMMRRGEKARDFKGTMRRLLAYLRAFTLPIVVVTLFAVASTVFNIFGPKVLGQATTKLFEGVMAQIAGTGGIDFTYIGNILILMAILYLLAFLLTPRTKGALVSV